MGRQIFISSTIFLPNTVLAVKIQERKPEMISTLLELPNVQQVSNNRNVNIPGSKSGDRHGFTSWLCHVLAV